MEEVILALAQGVISLLLISYSVYIFLEQGKKKAVFLIGGVGLLGLVLSGISAYRASEGQRAIATGISQISRQLADLHAGAPKHFSVGLSEDLRSGKSTSTIKEIPDSEYQRRYRILIALRVKYMVSNRDFRPGLVAGIDWPPIEWTNQELAKLGETWTAIPGGNSSELGFKESQP